MTGLFVDSIKDKSNTKTLATLSNSAVTLHSDVDIKSAINASGSAPIFAVRAWANFSGTTLNGSGNVASITNSGAGDYVINFTTALPANYSISVFFDPDSDSGYLRYAYLNSLSTSSATINTRYINGTTQTGINFTNITFIAVA